MAIIALLKSISVVSATFTKNVKIWLLHVAPSRQLKSQTSLEQGRIFPSGRIVYVGSDFTIHGLARKYDEGRKLNGKCLSINDMTLLLSSKAKQTRERLINGLAELFSEGHYIYSDFDKDREIKARFSLIANITPWSYLMNRKSLLGNTFIERCLVVHHSLTDEEMHEANLNLEVRKMMVAKKFRPTLCENDVTITGKDLRRLDEIAGRWKNIGGYSSITQVFEIVRSIAVGSAILSGHRKIGLAEYHFLAQLEPYVDAGEAVVREKISEL